MKCCARAWRREGEPGRHGMPLRVCPCGPGPSAGRSVLFHLMFHVRPGGAPLMRGARHCGGATLSRREQPTPAVLPAQGRERTPSHSPPPASTHPRRPARAAPRPLPFGTPPSPWPSASAIRHSRPSSRMLAATPPPPAAVLLRGLPLAHRHPHSPQHATCQFAGRRLPTTISVRSLRIVTRGGRSLPPLKHCSTTTHAQRMVIITRRPNAHSPRIHSNASKATHAQNPTHSCFEGSRHILFHEGAAPLVRSEVHGLS